MEDATEAHEADAAAKPSRAPARAAADEVATAELDDGDGPDALSEAEEHRARSDGRAASRSAAIDWEEELC